MTLSVFECLEKRYINLTYYYYYSYYDSSEHDKQQFVPKILQE